MRNKIFYIISFVLFLTLISACNTVEPTSMPTPSPTLDLQIGGAGGDSIAELGYSFDTYLKGLPEFDIGDLENLPVYKNLYPVGQEGIETEITDEMLAEFKANLGQYLQIAGIVDADKASDLSPNQELIKNKIFVWESCGYFISTGPYGISMSFDSEDIKKIGKGENELLLMLDSEKHLNAACQYLNIENPAYSFKTIYNVSGEKDEVMYMIYEAGDSYADTIYNRNFGYFTVSWHTDDSSNLVSIRIKKIDTSEKLGDYSLLPYEDALTMLSSSTGRDVPAKDILASEIVYNINILPGYFIPCYRFYVDEGEANTAVPGLRSFASYLAPAVDYESVIK